jgi:ribosomal protein S8
MGITDILNYLLVAIKVGYAGKKTYTYTKYNVFCLEVITILYKEDFIEGYSIDILNKRVKIKLKYFRSRPIISDLDLLTSPSFKNYLNCLNMTKIIKKYDYYFAFTSKGLIASKYSNIISEMNTGGLLLFGIKMYVY